VVAGDDLQPGLRGLGPLRRATVSRVPLTLVGADEPHDPPWPPATIAVHDLTELHRALGVVLGGRPVLVVVAGEGEVRRRIVDVLGGFCYGAGARTLKVGSRTFLALPAGLEMPAGAEALARKAEHVGSTPVDPDEEELLRMAAAAGDPEAHRRLVDAHAELAAVVAGILRPRHVPQAEAFRIAQRELGAAIAADHRRPLLVTLVDGIAAALGR
jgi:hypothetical protein